MLEQNRVAASHPLLLDPLVAICSALEVREMFEEPVLAEANQLPESMNSWVCDAVRLTMA